MFCLFQKYDDYQTSSLNLKESTSNNNILVKDTVQNEEQCEEISRIWNVRFDMMNEPEVPSNPIELSPNYGEGSTCSSLASDVSCDSVTQESTVELVSDTKDNDDTAEGFSPQLDQRLQSWRSTLFRTSQQQIIDCVVDSMCVTGDKIGSEWIRKDLQFQFEPMNNNVYKTSSDSNPVSSCYNPSATNKSLEPNFQSSQDQNFTELLIHQSNINESIEENNNVITDGNNFIVVNNSETVGNPQDGNSIPENALLVEIKTDSLAELNKGEYEIHIVENDPTDNNFTQTNETSKDVEVINNSENSSFSFEISESTNDIEGGNIALSCLGKHTETPTERTEYSNVKPVRACKGVRYREFMSTNQLGKRRVKQKQR